MPAPSPVPEPPWPAVERLFLEALDLTGEDRTALLAAEPDPTVRDAVADLLAALDTADGLLAALDGRPVTALLLADAVASDAEAAEADVPDTLGPGARVGPYRVEGELGRGGMGVVYRAARADGTFHKEVALKLVKRGMDTDEVLARFRRERRLLAGLDHGAVARLLDGGTAEDGRPFLVMELVNGEPITGYCDRRRLGVEARLALFEQACEAVAYAHRRLVVHRDLKPSNIFVAEGEQGEPYVKLLDFGIAKLLDPEADEALTQTGRRRLTPAYASPEQRRGEAVTTTADVYALGVVLYELLAGRRPEGLGRPPSVSVTPEAAAARGTAAEKLRRRLKGDLDTICLKALREEPEARYPSVEALLDDLRRHGSGLPVLARPASAEYRTRLFVRRHRVGVGATALVALALVVGLSAALWQARAAAREATRANEETAEAQAIAGFLENLLAAPDPRAEERLDTLSIREVLVRGTEQARRELDDQPLVQARLLHVLGRTYRRMRLFGEAEAALREALALRRTHLGSGQVEVAETLRELGLALQTRDGSDTGLPFLREALAIHRERLGPRHPETAVTMAGYANALLMASAAGSAGTGAETDAAAERMLREALAILQEAHGPYHSQVGLVLEELADRAQARGDMVEAVALGRRALAVQEHLYDARHPAVAQARGRLGWTLTLAGQPVEAERHLRAALAVQRELYGPHSNTVRERLTTLGAALRAQGRLDEAEAVLREALTAGVSRPANRAVTLGALASVLCERGDLAGAAEAQAEAVSLLREDYGPAAPILPVSVGKLAAILREQGRYAEAEAMLLEHLAPIREARGPADAGVRHLVGELAALYEAWGRPAQAAEYRALLDAPAAPPHPML
jgi:serine/threonine-protein kinase